MRMLYVIVMVTATLLAGCQESQRVWGQGELPVDYQEMFGNSNSARLDYAQTQIINRHNGIIYGFDTKDPNEQPVRKRGLIERVTALESLEERVRKLEKAEKKHIAIDVIKNADVLDNLGVPGPAIINPKTTSDPLLKSLSETATAYPVR